MTATLTAPLETVAQPAEDTTDPQPRAFIAQSLWTALRVDFHRLARTRAATAEYQTMRATNNWSAPTATQLADTLFDSPEPLSALVQYSIGGSNLARAIITEAFRPSLMSIARYARVDEADTRYSIGTELFELRAHTVLVTFYEVLNTTSTGCPDVRGRLYGETLKRVTKSKDRPWMESIDESVERVTHMTLNAACGYGGRGPVLSEWQNFFGLDQGPDILNWDRIETVGLLRNILDAAYDEGILDSLDVELLRGRFLGDAMVSVATLARRVGEPVGKCESRIKRATAKLVDRYNSGHMAAAA